MARHKVLILCLCPPQVPSTLVRSPLKGCRGLRIVLLLNPLPSRRKDGPPLLPPVLCVSL